MSQFGSPKQRPETRPFLQLFYGGGSPRKQSEPRKGVLLVHLGLGPPGILEELWTALLSFHQMKSGVLSCMFGPCSWRVTSQGH
jgi:hypothetical protein